MEIVANSSTATTVLSVVTFSPGPSYSIGIPSSSKISSSSTGDLYFQLSASTSYQWVGLGIGAQMAGATIFVMYADGTGNVTISARDGGGGHVEPTLDSTVQAGVTLLAGSGIVENQMIANVKCKNLALALKGITHTSRHNMQARFFSLLFLFSLDRSLEHWIGY